VLRLYLIFLWDAVQVVAASVVAVLVAIAAFNQLGVPPTIVSIAWWPLAFMGFTVLAHRYVGRNLGWILGLPQRKVSLAWFNFGMNLSLLALVIVAGCTVIAATYVLFPDDPSRTVVAALTKIHSLSRPHGRTLAILVFFVTMMLFTCGNVMRQPDAAERARQKGRRLLGILIFFMVIPVFFGFVSSLARPTTQPNAVSPLLVFVAGMALVCISMPYGTAKSLGTSVRQRRVWMLVGAAIGFAEIVALVAVTLSDLKSADPSIRREAAQLLGSSAGPTGQGADLADDRTAANPALNGEPRARNGRITDSRRVR